MLSQSRSFLRELNLGTKPLKRTHPLCLGHIDIEFGYVENRWVWRRFSQKWLVHCTIFRTGCGCRHQRPDYGFLYIARPIIINQQGCSTLDFHSFIVRSCDIRHYHHVQKRVHIFNATNRATYSSSKARYFTLTYRPSGRFDILLMSPKVAVFNTNNIS